LKQRCRGTPFSFEMKNFDVTTSPHKSMRVGIRARHARVFVFDMLACTHA
jgi:hypothetical protein